MPTKRTPRTRKLGPDVDQPLLRPLAPRPDEGIPAVFLATPVMHPLIYRKRIKRVDSRARPGDLVAVYHVANKPEGELFAYGLYNPRSEIAVRLLRLSAELPDDTFWEDRLKVAVALRRDVLGLDETATAYRVIHAEADGFPGLVVDRFGDVLSAEVFSLGMYQRAEEVIHRLQPRCGTASHVIQTSPTFLSQEGFDPPAVRSPDVPPSVTIQEHGTRFRVHFGSGHKTGFFCDQRDNRRRLAKYCEGKTVLDLCCYTGGFSIQAKRLGNAAEVTGVDLDAEPLKLARENAGLNQVRVRFVQADIFAYMRDMLRESRQFDVVVLDPPKLIRNRLEIEDGTRKYFDMNRLAMQLVRPGGLLLSCSCSGLMPSQDFQRMLFSAARQAGPAEPTSDTSQRPRGTPRRAQILGRTGAAADHPVSSDCPETEYLKAVWMRLL
jgi:23S rRNA (cytosine1962-C5)-methyltransferase